MKALQLKIPPPIVALLFGLLIWYSATLLQTQAFDHAYRQAIALLLFAIAGCMDIWALLSFRKAKTTIDPRYPHKTSRVIAHGVYQHTRNPMYLGLALILSALSIWQAAPAGLLLVAAFVLYLNKFQIEPEEQQLERLFNDEYLAYKKRVRRWL